MNEAIEELLAGKDDIFFSNLLLATQALSSSGTLIGEKKAREIVNRALNVIADKRSYHRVAERILDTLVNTYDNNIHSLIFDRFLRTCQQGQPVFIFLQYLGPFITFEQSRLLFNVLLSPYLNRQENLQLINLFPVANSPEIAFEMLRLLEEPGLSVEAKNLVITRITTAGHRELIETLLRLLQNTNVPLNIRENIALNLEKVGDDTTVKILRAMVDDPLYDFILKPSLAVALLNQGEKRIVRFMLQLLHAPDVSRRSKQILVTRLLALQDDKVTLELCRMLLDPALHNENKEQIIAQLPGLITNPEMLAEVAALTINLPGFLYETIYKVLYEAAKRLQVRLYLDDSQRPYRFYTKPLPTNLPVVSKS